MKIVDAKGQTCPKPLILTKKALKDVAVNERFIILIDNETSMENVSRFLKDNNVGFDISEENGVYKLHATKLEEGSYLKEVETYCSIPKKKKGKHVYVFKTNGVAEDELGKMLTGGFLDTIKEVAPLPEKIILYHKGVYLALDNSPYLEKIRDLENLGVEIFICGNCVNFYNVKEKVGVGIISNAYTILKAFSDASHLIYP